MKIAAKQPFFVKIKSLPHITIINSDFFRVQDTSKLAETISVRLKLSN